MKKILVAILYAIMLTAIVFPFLVLAGWMTMIAVGVIHAIFNWPAITISIVQGCQLSIALSFLTLVTGLRRLSLKK